MPVTKIASTRRLSEARDEIERLRGGWREILKVQDQTSSQPQWIVELAQKMLEGGKER
jgi:hypothetical protein